MTSVAGAPPGVDDPSGTAATPARPRWPAVILSALVVTLARPATWAYGLLGFLAGGGLVIVAWPILVLPTPTGLQNDLGGPVSRLVLGTPSMQLVALVAVGALAGIAVLAVATATGAWAERRGIETALQAAAAEGLDGVAADLAGAPGIGPITVIRLLALVPVGVAAILAWGPVYDAAYRELILPDDLVTPLPLRVIRDVPWPLAGVAVTWLVADAAAAIGVRRLVLEGRPVVAAWLLGWADIARQPGRILGTAVAGAAAVGLALGPLLLASGAGWAHVRAALLLGRDPVGLVVAVGTWVALWLGGLAIVGVAAGVRATAWTVAAAWTAAASGAMATGMPTRAARSPRHDHAQRRV